VRQEVERDDPDALGVLQRLADEPQFDHLWHWIGCPPSSASASCSATPLHSSSLSLSHTNGFIVCRAVPFRVCRVVGRVARRQADAKAKKGRQPVLAKGARMDHDFGSEVQGLPLTSRADLQRFLDAPLPAHWSTGKWCPPAPPLHPAHASPKRSRPVVCVVCVACVACVVWSSVGGRRVSRMPDLTGLDDEDWTIGQQAIQDRCAMIIRGLASRSEDVQRFRSMCLWTLWRGTTHHHQPPTAAMASAVEHDARLAIKWVVKLVGCKRVIDAARLVDRLLIPCAVATAQLAPITFDVAGFGRKCLPPTGGLHDDVVPRPTTFWEDHHRSAVSPFINAGPWAMHCACVFVQGQYMQDYLELLRDGDQPESVRTQILNLIAVRGLPFFLMISKLKNDTTHDTHNTRTTRHDTCAHTGADVPGALVRHASACGRGVPQRGGALVSAGHSSVDDLLHRARRAGLVAGLQPRGQRASEAGDR